MNTRHRIVAPAMVLAALLAGSAAASAAGGNGASPCSQSGRVEIGGQTVIDTFGHAVVAAAVHDAHFSGTSNPGHGFDWAYGQAGDGPVAAAVCSPQR